MSVNSSPSDAVPHSYGRAIIEAVGLVKRYGETVAVAGVDLTVHAGEIFGILGPNGAGKTTLLEMIEGLRAPDAGEIAVGGLDALQNGAEVRRMIGVQLQTTALFDYLTAAEILSLFAGLYEVDASPTRIDQLLGMVGLSEKRDSRVHQLSGGQQQRLSIALGLVNNPVIAFLDEPTTGLDPAARRSVWQTIRTIRDAGATVVLTTHYMEEAEVLCDRLAIMDFGRIIALDTPQGLIETLDAVATVRARVERGSISIEDLVALPDVTESHGNGTLIELRTRHPQRTLLGLLDLAGKSGTELVDLRSAQATLEDVFLSLTGRAYAPGADEVAESGEPSQSGRGGRERRRSGR
jgi:ABC-2 type transport system ATP-binding protein